MRPLSTRRSARWCRRHTLTDSSPHASAAGTTSGTKSQVAETTPPAPAMPPNDEQVECDALRARVQAFDEYLHQLHSEGASCSSRHEPLAPLPP